MDFPTERPPQAQVQWVICHGDPTNPITVKRWRYSAFMPLKIATEYLHAPYSQSSIHNLSKELSRIAQELIPVVQANNKFQCSHKHCKRTSHSIGHRIIPDFATTHPNLQSGKAPQIKVIDIISPFCKELECQHYASQLAETYAEAIIRDCDDLIIGRRPCANTACAKLVHDGPDHEAPRLWYCSQACMNVHLALGVKATA